MRTLTDGGDGMVRLGGEVAVVGGSVAGCAAAIAAANSGAEQVTVFERSPGDLCDRGNGIGIASGRYAALSGAGYLDTEIPSAVIDARLWITTDGTDAGRIIWRQPFDFHMFNWAGVWGALRRRLPSSVSYRVDAQVAGVKSSPDEAVVEFAGGELHRFDIAIGADGYRSVVRTGMACEAAPQYAGYVAWRGCFPEHRLTDAAGDHWRAVAGGRAAMLLFPGGHVMAYRIPGASAGAPDLVNWVMYLPPVASAASALATPTSIRPGAVPAELATQFSAVVAEHLPPLWSAILRETGDAEMSIQPIYDLAVASYVSGRTVLLGDAGTVLRPHTGGGVNKAISDAQALETTASSAGSWSAALAEYDDERRASGAALAGWGQRLGAGLVTEPLPWASLSAADLEAWWVEQLP